MRPCARSATSPEPPTRDRTGARPPSENRAKGATARVRIGLEDIVRGIMATLGNSSVFVLAAAVGLPGMAIAQTSALSFSLTYLDRAKIEDDEEGLTEPSGLALSQDGDALVDRERRHEEDLQAQP